MRFGIVFFNNMNCSAVFIIMFAQQTVSWSTRKEFKSVTNIALITLRDIFFARLGLTS